MDDIKGVMDAIKTQKKTIGSRGTCRGIGYMKTISEIFRNELKTRDDITRVARSVEIKQRDAKRYAINYVIDAWERLCSAAERNEVWYTVVHGYKCKQCGGVILRRVGPFSKFTCGGPAIGCPVCQTISSSKMMQQRTDIIRSEHIADVGKMVIEKR